MADNFNLKQYLVENKLGSYSKAVLNEDTASKEVEESKHDPIDPEDPYGTGGMSMAGMFEEGTTPDALNSLSNVEGILLNLKRNIATDSTIGTESKQGLLKAFKDIMEELQTIGYELEREEEEEHVSDYSKRRASEK